MTAKGKDNPLQTGRWHLARVKVRADHGECYLDGAKIFDFKAEHHAGGMVGLRTGNAPYRFKNIKVTAPDGTVLLEGLPDLAPAAAPAPGGFVALFDGTSIDGWKRSKENGYWQVKDGILTGSGPNACDLYTRKNDFANFHIRAEARINDRGLSGLFFRATPDLSGGMGGNNGYYAWLTNNDPRKNLKFKTGNISIYPDKGSPYNTPPVAGDLAPAGEWFLLEIIAKGNQVKIMVNSKEGRSIYRNDVPFIPRGCFILQGGQTPQTVVEYRKIEIKEFPGK